MSDDQPETLNGEMQLMMGLNLAIIHIFNCLNGKGILPFSEAAQSLRESIDLLDSAPQGAIAALSAIATTLEILDKKSDTPDPSKPPPPIRLH